MPAHQGAAAPAAAAADPFDAPQLNPGFLTDPEGADMATLRWVAQRSAQQGGAALC